MCTLLRQHIRAERLLTSFQLPYAPFRHHQVFRRENQSLIYICSRFSGRRPSLLHHFGLEIYSFCTLHAWSAVVILLPQGVFLFLLAQTILSHFCLLSFKFLDHIAKSRNLYVYSLLVPKHRPDLQNPPKTRLTLTLSTALHMPKFAVCTTFLRVVHAEAKTTSDVQLV